MYTGTKIRIPRVQYVKCTTHATSNQILLCISPYSDLWYLFTHFHKHFSLYTFQETPDYHYVCVINVSLKHIAREH